MLWGIKSLTLELRGTEDEDALTEDALTEDALTEDALTEDALTEGAFTEDVFTEDAFTEDALRVFIALFMWEVAGMLLLCVSVMWDVVPIYKK